MGFRLDWMVWTGPGLTTSVYCYKKKWETRIRETREIENCRRMATNGRRSRIASVFLLLLLSLPSISLAYRPGDIVPMSKMGQYHSVRSLFHFQALSLCLLACLLHWFYSYFIDFMKKKIEFWFQSRTVWQDVIGKHCPIFGVNREVSSLIN